jgi:hypothetical protein
LSSASTDFFFFFQFQQLLVQPQPATQSGGPQTYTMNVQTVTPQQVTVVKRHRDM